MPSAFFMGARKNWENRGNLKYLTTESTDHKALTDQGKWSQLRNHFARKTSARTAATESGLARRTRRLTQIRNKHSSSASICSAGKGFFSHTRKILMAEEGLAEARQHGFSLATFDQPLAKGFADETGLVELLH
jgi:hypothetical protein